MNTQQLDSKKLAHLNPKILKTAHKIRVKHLLEFPTGRLVGTIASRIRDDGMVEVAASIVNPSQGKTIIGHEPGREIITNGKGGEAVRITTKPRPIREPSPTRAAGREAAIDRLINSFAGEIFPIDKAQERLRLKVRDYRDGGPRPSDVKVVVMTHDQLKKLIYNRQILSLFPGSKWVPKALRPRMPFKPRKPKSLLSRFMSIFNRTLDCKKGEVCRSIFLMGSILLMVMVKPAVRKCAGAQFFQIREERTSAG